ncbi:hypothetical protein NQZ68_004482 [Dissostichus eleginoides]|nr:hypothetical protein NQZ68_004482 [Dissostichus eleginoides]
MLSKLENKVHPQQIIPELRHDKYDMNRMVSRMKRLRSDITDAVLSASSTHTPDCRASSLLSGCQLSA